MKKLLLIMLCMPLFLACDNEDVTIPILNNTRWENMENGIHVAVEFHDSESTLIISNVDNAKYTSTQYDCIYEYPNITMHPKNSNEDKIECALSPDNKTMVLKNLSTSKIIAILTQR